jgi:hypothetical protein
MNRALETAGTHRSDCQALFRQYPISHMQVTDHDFSPPGEGAACGKSRVTELVTARLFASWLETLPARLVATDNATIGDAAAIVPVPTNAPQNRRSDPIPSSFGSEVFARRSPDRLASYLRSEASLRSRPHSSQGRSADRAANQSRIFIWWMRCSLRQPL